VASSEGGRGRQGGVRKLEDSLPSTFGEWKRQRARWRWQPWWRCSVHGGHVQSRCHLLKRFLEHVACNEVSGVGGDFGPFPDELDIGPKMKFAQLGLFYNFD